jgi:hypothetical protein
LLEYELANAHARSQPDWQFAMIDHFESNMPIETSMDGWRCYVNAQSQSSERAFALDPSCYAIM